MQGDQRLPHDSGRAVDVDALGKLGVLYYHFPDLDGVNQLATERGYKNRDEIFVSPEKMGDVYEDKVKMFFNEHLHEDEEIRYVRGGQGYFDVRSKDDEWVRVQLEKDDLLILPAGIYHRFTTDESNVSLAHRVTAANPKGLDLTDAYSMYTPCVSSRTSPSGRHSTGAPTWMSTLTARGMSSSTLRRRQWGCILYNACALFPIACRSYSVLTTSYKSETYLILHHESDETLCAGF